jgi:hypothetical protein
MYENVPHPQLQRGRRPGGRRHAASWQSRRWRYASSRFPPRSSSTNPSGGIPTIPKPGPKPPFATWSTTERRRSVDANPPRARDRRRQLPRRGGSESPIQRALAEDEAIRCHPWLPGRPELARPTYQASAAKPSAGRFRLLHAVVGQPRYQLEVRPLRTATRTTSPLNGDTLDSVMEYPSGTGSSGRR